MFKWIKRKIKQWKCKCKCGKLVAISVMDGNYIEEYVCVDCGTEFIRIREVGK